MFRRLAALALLVAPVAAQDLTTRLDDVLFRLGGTEGVRTWELAGELRDASRADTIRAVPHLAEAATEATPQVRLVIARTLLEVDAPHEAAEVLLPMTTGFEAEAAFSVLSDKAFRRVPEVSNHLRELLDGPLAASLRVAAARTLYKVTSDTRARVEARRVLLDTLESDDPEVRARGALALAEISDFEPARPVLRTLMADPGRLGQLARAYLETDEKIDYYTEKLYRQSEQLPPASERLSYGRESFSTGVGSLDVLEELISFIQEHHLLGEQLDGSEGRERLITAAAKGMLSALDEHSTYFSSAEFERWILDLRRNYAGIGAYVDTINSVFTITKPIYSGPAYEKGLRSGDQIHKVDGWDTFDQPNDEIIRRLKGEPGTEVTVTVYRPGWQKTRDFVINRNVISIPSVNWDMLPGDIGYAEILGFAEGTSDELAAAILALQAEGVEGIILDLRNNSGGYLEEAVKICSLFLPPAETVVYTEGRGVDRRTFYTKRLRNGATYDGPLVVLVNTRSASASEIVAGALQEYERGAVVGETTFGKGSVQQAMPLETRPGDRLLTDANGNRSYDPGEEYNDVDSDGKYTYPVNVKITNARYYLPSGTSLHTERDLDGRIVKHGGVEPDVEVSFEGLAGWENHELAELLDGLDGANPFSDYAKENFEANLELFELLALGDDHDASRYPGFDAFRQQFETPLPDDTIRLMLRSAVRDEVADFNGKAFPGGFIYGDWQEDNQLQMAIAVIADEMALDLTAQPAYDDFADLEPQPR